MKHLTMPTIQHLGPPALTYPEGFFWPLPAIIREARSAFGNTSDPIDIPGHGVLRLPNTFEPTAAYRDSGYYKEES